MGLSWPARDASRVDLPHPLGPIMQSISPRLMVRSMLSSAMTWPLNSCEMLSSLSSLMTVLSSSMIPSVKRQRMP